MASRDYLATRNLTAAFNRARSAFLSSRSPAGTGPDYGSTGTAGGGYDMRSLDEDAGSSLPPIYVDRVDEINEEIDTIKSKIKELVSSHRERLSKLMEDEESELERQIEILTGDITQRFSNAGNKLKSLAIGSSGGATAEDAIRLNIQRSLARKLQTLSSEFRKSQKKYFAELKEQKAAASGDLGVLTGGRGGGGAAGSRPTPEDDGFDDGMMMEMEEAEDLAAERDEEIAAIAKSIQELAEIFKELNVLVVEQGSLLDRIDHNIDLTVTRVHEGTEHLKKAEEYQKSARPFYCMIGLTVVIVILVIIIIARKT